MKHPFAVTAMMLIVLSGVTGRAQASEPCCNVTAIDARTGVVTAKDKASGREFKFHVTQAASLRTLRAGSPVYADFAAKNVSLNEGAVCCAIVAISAARGAPSGVQGNAGRP